MYTIDFLNKTEGRFVGVEDFTSDTDPFDMKSSNIGYDSAFKLLYPSYLRSEFTILMHEMINTPLCIIKGTVLCDQSRRDES